jgi:hypothetical protein
VFERTIERRSIRDRRVFDDPVSIGCGQWPFGSSSDQRNEQQQSAELRVLAGKVAHSGDRSLEGLADRLAGCCSLESRLCADRTGQELLEAQVRVIASTIDVAGCRRCCDLEQQRECRVLGRRAHSWLFVWTDKRVLSPAEPHELAAAQTGL